MPVIALCLLTSNKSHPFCLLVSNKSIIEEGTVPLENGKQIEVIPAWKWLLE